MKKRIDKIRKYLAKNNLDAIYLFYPVDSGNFLPNVRYLTGFSGSTGAVFVTRKKAWFISDSRYADQSRQEVSGCTIVISKKSTIAAMADIKEAQARNLRVAVEAHRFTVEQKFMLQQAMPNAILIDVKDVVEDLSIIKEASEIQKIKKAVAISDAAFDRILNFLKPGLSEKEVAAELEYQMKMMGADKEAFSTIVASGYRSAMPHGTASAKKIKKGDFVTFDFGALYQGYCSDITRTVVMGKANARQKKIYTIVLKAQLAAIKKTRAGIAAKMVDEAARSIIKKAGFDKNFGHGTGHGIGLEVHAGPRVSPLSEQVLKSQMVITIEPGVYISGWGGVRIEDDVVVRPGGCTVLNKAPKNLLEL